MTWTYSTDPATSAKDEVRFLLNDVDIANPLFSDEQIAWMILEYGPNIYDVCRNGAETLAGRFAGLADNTSKSVADIHVSTSYANTAKRYRELADSFLKRRLRKSRPSIGVVADSLLATRERTDGTTPHSDFFLGQMDNPNSVVVTYPELK